MTDIAASVLVKLQNKAKETGRAYQLCLQLFCQEEFLRRVALSRYADNLVLKGGLFIYTLTEFESRATVDIDFLLKKISNTGSEILRIVEEIAIMDTGNDFIAFEVKSVSSITLQRKYNGFSVAVIGKVKNTRMPFKIDFGVGDIIVPKSEKRKIPTQLNGFTQPEISTYSLESTISEKFDAIISRFDFTSRMKDFFDIYYLARTFNFEGRKLQEAIFETLQNRGTSYGCSTFDNIESLGSFEAMTTRWKVFLKKIKTPKLEFEEVLNVIKMFLKPVFEAVIEEREFFEQWSCARQEWNK